MLRDQRRLRAGGICANARFTSIKHKYLDRHSHVASLHRLGNPGCGGGRVAAVFGQNELPTNHQTDSCAEKVIKTHRKINIFRLDLATKDAASEKHFADVSFYLNKTSFFGDGSRFLNRPINLKSAQTKQSTWMAGGFPAHLGDKLFGAPEKVHTSAAKFVFKFTSKNKLPY